MQGGARKAAMAGFFFFTKKRLDGAASVPRRPPRASGRLTILPTIPADTRASPARQAGFMPGSDRCAAILVPSRARQAAKSSDAGTEAGAAPPPRSRARQAGLTILPTIPADTRAPPARQVGFMPGSDRCAATLVPSRARQTAKASGAGTEAGAAPPPRSRARRAGLTILPTIPADTRAPPARQAGFMPGSDRCAATRPSRARVGPQNRTMQARKPGPYPRRPPRSSGRPDDFADHSSGYPRPSHAAGRLYGGSDRCAAILVPSRARQAGFMPGSDRCAATRPSRARQTAKSSDAGTEAGAAPPPCQTGGAGRDAARRAALVRTAFSFAMEARCIRKGGGKGGAAQGETGAAAERRGWKSG